VHAYLLALWIADIGHVGATAWMMGHDAFVDLRSWNAMAWANVGVTGFLFGVRSLYMLGLMGRDRVVTKEVKRYA